MPRITYIEFGGEAHVVDAAPGLTLMAAAVQNKVPGIEADCGGNCACATCHVYIDEAWLAKTGQRTTLEDSMIDFVVEPAANSRLACQIKLDDELDGLVVRMPASQR